MNNIPSEIFEAEQLAIGATSSSPLFVRTKAYAAIPFKLSGGAFLQLEGTSDDDWLSVPFTTRTSGPKIMQIVFMRGPSGGIYHATLDDTPIVEEYDSYAFVRSRTTQTIHIGHFEAGAHTLRFRVIGKHPSACGYEVALDVFTFYPDSDSGSARR